MYKHVCVFGGQGQDHWSLKGLNRKLSKYSHVGYQMKALWKSKGTLVLSFFFNWLNLYKKAALQDILITASAKTTLVSREKDGRYKLYI